MKDDRNPNTVWGLAGSVIPVHFCFHYTRVIWPGGQRTHQILSAYLQYIFLDSKNLLYEPNLKVKAFKKSFPVWQKKKITARFSPERSRLWLQSDYWLQNTLKKWTAFQGRPTSYYWARWHSPASLTAPLLIIYFLLFYLTTIFWERTKVWGIPVAGRELAR